MAQPIKTIPPSPVEEKLREKFAESVANQGDLLDHLARQLITLELALPGLYATVLKLTSGDKATLGSAPLLWIAFGCWLAALILSLFSLFPRKWPVDPGIMKQDPGAKAKELGIEDFFTKSAQHKRGLLLPSCLLFFGGIVCAAMTIF